MYLNEEEDEKQSDPFICSETLIETVKKSFESKTEDFKKVFNTEFIDHMIASIQLPGSVNIKQEGPQQFSFMGFPNSDYFKQIAIVLTLWNKKAQFPIDFTPIEGFTDETT